MPNSHEYSAHLQWTGNTGSGTLDYRSYGREYRILVPGKRHVTGSADPQFLGNAELPSPEDMLLSALSACHMLTYLALCAKSKIRVETYEDNSSALVAFDASGGGEFDHAVLRPMVRIHGASRLKEARALHRTAHERCFIAQSVSFPVKNQATVVANETRT